MPPKHAPATPTFEQALDELDTLVRRMESGELSLDESIAAYRRGAELARFCQARLAQAEQEIKQLEGDMLKPLDPAELGAPAHERARPLRSAHPAALSAEGSPLSAASALAGVQAPEALDVWVRDAGERFERAAGRDAAAHRTASRSVCTRRCGTRCWAAASACGRCWCTRPGK